MRKFQYLFVTLSAMFLAVPAFAQSSPAGTTTGYGLTAIAAAPRHGPRRRPMRPWSGARHCLRNRGFGP